MSRGELRAAQWVAPRRHPLTKVPEVTAYFWITKVLTTGMGEATSDYLVHRFNPEIAVVAGFTAFAAAMGLQFSFRRYHTWAYWLAVVMVAVFGTMAADVLHVGLGIPYAVSTAFYAVVLAVIFVLWYRSEGTLSIHSIYTRRREVFYWATVLATFALGTAAGDLTAKVVGLGYLGSGVMFAVVIAIPYVGYRWFGLNPIVAFWFAYIVTRPLGASFADWLAWPPSAGGLGFGHGMVSLVSTLIIIGLVGYMAVSGKDVMVRVGGPRPSARLGRLARSGGSGFPARSASLARSGRPARSGQSAQPDARPGPGPDDRPVQPGRHRRPD
ncbi:MAG TPA: hypothetical protein VEH31_13715 [Streptosporangiaceae bacterium]|nr:hypothetical protein [Streptosporangiaceae bacterium]